VINSGSNYLNCDCDGNASVGNSFSTSSLWIPERIGGKVVSLRSWFGGFLGIDQNGLVSCKARVTCEENEFQVISSSNDCAQDAPNYVLLKGINGMYLNIDQNGASGLNNLQSQGQVFKSYNYDQTTSLCNTQNVVTATPPTTSTDTTDQPLQCHEVEIEEKDEKPKRKKHNHKKTCSAKKEDKEDCGCN